MQSSEVRYRWATRIGALALAASLLAFAWPTWLEGWIGDGVDGGDGSLEYGIAVGLAVVALALLAGPVVARRRARRDAAAGG